MKNTILLITVSGEDRPGIVGEIANRVHERGGNWERSRLIHLAGRFVGLLQVSVPDDRSDPLRADLLAIPGLEITVARGGETGGRAGHRFDLSLVGADHPGIVREIFGSLAGLGLNVESLATRTEAAAGSGTLLFRAEALLSTETALDTETVRTTLEALAHDLQVDVSIGKPD